jgi:hypothetical protein
MSYKPISFCIPSLVVKPALTTILKLVLASLVEIGSIFGEENV